MDKDIDRREVAIQLSGIKKRYQLGQIGSGTLQGDLQSLWARIRGREDPNGKVGNKSQIYGKSFMALDGINLTVYKGEALGIIGANGAGKSTLLKLLSRVTAPTEGEIDIYGRISSMLEIGTGFNSQMTGRENIYLNGAILGMTKAEIDQKIDSIIAFSEVSEFIDTPVKRYSSGMFVKLAFSVAAHLNSDIMIMDEVLAVGDIAFQKKCLKRMKEAASVEDRSILYVSHNMNTIRELCDRCIVMDKGRIIYDGDVDRAIGMYMNLTLQENQIEVDLRTHISPSKRKSENLELLHLKLLGKDAPIYDSGDILKIGITLQNKQKLGHVQIRLTLRADTDQAIGTAWSYPFDLQRVGKQDIECAFSLDEIADGDVYISIGLYQMNDSGKMIQLDHATRAFRISVDKKIGIHGWSLQAYGPIQFPDMECRLL